MAQHDVALSDMFQALSDPTRRGMLARLGRGAVTVSALAAPTGMALPTILRHLAVLEAAGLITTVKVGRARTCAVVPGALAVMQDWLEAQRAVWHARTDRLQDDAETLMQEQKMIIDPDTDLVLTRDINAPRHLLWACWTTPAHLMQWFVPKPHMVTACHLDLRVGGAFNTTFDVDGAVIENRGVYLEVIPEVKLVFTDTYTEGWKPAAEPFMTAIITFEDLENGQTRYQALVRHRSKDAAGTHREMGFFEGWGTAAEQLEACARRLL